MPCSGDGCCAKALFYWAAVKGAEIWQYVPALGAALKSTHTYSISDAIYCPYLALVPLESQAPVCCAL